MGAEEAKKMNDWIKRRKDFLVYIGNPGCGKTYFSAALMNLHLDKPIYNSARYFNERQLLSKIREEMEFGSYQEILRYATDDELLILDDLGSGGFGEWGRNVLFDLIDSRYSSMFPTLITTNLTEAAIKEEYGERMSSRIFDKGTVVIQINGKDLRAREGA